MKKTLVVILVIVLCVMSFFIGRNVSHTPSLEYEVVDTIVHIDTVKQYFPVPRDSVVVKYQCVIVPITPPPRDSVEVRNGKSDISVSVTKDSVEVQVPITSKSYVSEDYRAYVSGYQANLDSIFIINKSTDRIVNLKPKDKRFSIGIQAGYGITPKGFQPFVGVGVSYKLF